MSPRNVIIFGDPTTDRRFVVKLAGTPVNANDPSPTGIFETKQYPVTILEQKYTLYNTAGLTDADGDKLCLSKARQALGNLYRLTHMLDGDRVHLLIFVVSGQPSLKNLKLFHDCLCREDVPMILIMTNPIPASMPDDFPQVTVLTLDGTLTENDKAILVQDTIIRMIKQRKPESVHPMRRFELTAGKCWKLLEKEAGWSLTDCRAALEATFVEDANFSEEEAQARCKEISDYIKTHYFRNVIVFGDTGAGKTSVIQMLTDECEIDIKKAASAGGSTSKSQAYDIDIRQRHYIFHDTVGLDDQTSASMSPEEALRNLYQLILKVDGGISLLVYVHRGKIIPSQVSNYQLFSQVICDNKVPTVLVVTGLEKEDLETDDWWEANKDLYTKANIETKYHACITSDKGKFDERYKEFKYQIEYDQSKEKLEKLFLGAALVKPWKIKRTASFWRSLVVRVYNIFATKFKWGPLAANPLLHKRLMDVVGMEGDAAMSLANNLEGVSNNFKWGARAANPSFHKRLLDIVGMEDDPPNLENSDSVSVPALPVVSCRPGPSSSGSVPLGNLPFFKHIHSDPASPRHLGGSAAESLFGTPFF